MVKYAQKGFIEAFCQSITKADLTGTIGVLTYSNEEAYLAASRLKNLGIPATLVASTKEFQLKNLIELKEFSFLLEKAVNSVSGWISNEIWNKLKQKLKAKYERSADWPLVDKIIHTFDREKKHKYRVDWLEYINHAKIEDFYNEEKGRVFVSTMHKIKGKQFDKVFLLLDSFKLKGDAEARVVYVAITRPRNYLEIHTHLPIFDQIATPGLKKKTGNSSIESLPVFTIQCSLSDLVLSHFHNEDIKERVKLLVAGDNLEFSLGAQFYRAILPGQWNEMAACFSTSFKDTLDQHFSKGYKIKNLKVGHIVYWWDKEMEAGVRVVLPEIELGK